MRQLALILIVLCGLASATVYTPTAFRIDGTGTAPAALTGTATASAGVLTIVTGAFSCAGELNEGILYGGLVYTITTCSSSSSVTVTPTVTNGSATAFTVLGSATYAPGSANGWVLEIDVPTIAAGGTFGNFGFVQSANNTPSSPSVIVTVTHSGYQGTVNGGTCGTATNYTQTLYATKTLREPNPNYATNDAINVSGTTTFRLALGSATGPAWIFSGDTVTVQVANSFYTDGSSNTIGTVTSGTSVTNNSTLSYAMPRAIFNWTYPGWQRVTGASFTVRGTGFAQFPMNSLPLACVVFTATDQHSHSVTSTVGFPTIDPTLGDQAPIVEYIGSISTSTFTNHDQIKVTFIAYPWVGTSSSVMDSSDAVYAQPTPLYAPIYFLFDSGNNYSAAAYVDGSETFPGSHTSGTFVAGEKVTQSTSTATAYLIDTTGANGAGPIHIGAIATGTTNSTNGSTWTGGTSGAVFTQTGAPTAAGSDSNSCAAAESGGQPATACATINGAMVKMATFNHASSTPPQDHACGIVYVDRGYYNWMGSSAAASNVTGLCWVNVTPATGATKAQVVIDQQSGNQGFGSRCSSGTSSCGTPIHLQGVTILIATGPTSVFSGSTYLWLDRVSFSSGGTAPIYQVTDTYVTDSTIPSTLAGVGLRPFGGVAFTFPIMRGNDLSTVGSMGVMTYTVVGNTNKSSQNIFLTNEYSGETASLMPIVAFNTFYYASTSVNSPFGLTATTNSIIGEAVVQNIIENLYYTDSLSNMALNADSATATPVNNVMIWNNTIAGGRMNRAYNETNSTVLLRQGWSEVGNLMNVVAIKSDTFNGTRQGGRVGNWAELYGSGNHSDLYVEATGFAATGVFCNEFVGVNTSYPSVSADSTQPLTCATSNTYTYPSFKNYQAGTASGAGSGGGDYDLLSNSPAVNFFPAGTNVLPYDLAGQVRNNSGWGSAGAFEQAKILPGFAF